MSDAQPPSPPSTACCPDPDGMSVRLDRQEVLFDVLRLSLLDDDLDDLLGSALERITRVRSLQLEAREASGGNALKYVADGASPCVEIESRVVEGEWWVEVRDNGIGIDPEQSHRLFAIFSRLQGPAEYEGNGVGLALCRRIIEHHGGTIEAESAGEGCGATFSFCLPLGSASEPAA